MNQSKFIPISDWPKEDSITIEFDLIQIHKALDGQWIPWPPQGQFAQDYDRTSGFLSWLIRNKIAGKRRVFSINNNCLFPHWRPDGSGISPCVKAYLIGLDHQGLLASETGYLNFPVYILLPEHLSEIKIP